jgi:head-tail adaptor
MGLGRMNTFVDIIEKQIIKDSEGFSIKTDNILASVRAYREGRHGSERWANRAAFSDASDLFRFRKIPGVEITTAMVISCDAGRFEITSIEDVKGRDMYIEILAREVKPGG